MTKPFGRRYNRRNLKKLVAANMAIWGLPHKPDVSFDPDCYSCTGWRGAYLFAYLHDFNIDKLIQEIQEERKHENLNTET